jgi:hypothetical protein
MGRGLRAQPDPGAAAQPGDVHGAARRQLHRCAPVPRVRGRRPETRRRGRDQRARRSPARACPPGADHRRRHGRRHGVAGARQRAAACTPLQRSDRRLRPGLPDLSVGEIPPQQGVGATGFRALRRGRPGLWAIPHQPRRAACRRGARRTAARARAHGRARSDITGVAESAADGRGEALYKAGKFAVRYGRTGARTRSTHWPTCAATRRRAWKNGCPRDGRVALWRLPERGANAKDADKVRTHIKAARQGHGDGEDSVRARPEGVRGAISRPP